MDDKYIVLYGNPVDGMTFCGPFEDFEEAELHTEVHDNDWWIASMRDPDHAIKDASAEFFARLRAAKDSENADH